MMPGQTSLSLAELEAFDPGAPRGDRRRRFLCPLADCRGKTRQPSHRSLSMDVATGAWRCHRCDVRGILCEWKQERPWLPPGERRRGALRQAFSLSETKPCPPPEVSAAEAPASAETAWRQQLQGVRPLHGTPGEAYLRRRRIPVELAHRAGVRYTLDWYGRPAVLFPIRDRDGRLVACQGRYVDNGEEPRMRTGGPKLLGVFATPGARQAREVAIVEAPLDALSLAACGVPSLALAGTAWPDWLAQACAFRRVLLATDADAAGEAAVAKLAAALRACGARVVRLRPQGSKDWNEALQKDADGLRRTLRALLGAPAPDLAAAAPGGGEDSAPRTEQGLGGAALVTAVLERFDGRLLEPGETIGCKGD
jgi:hypothetical protein